MDLGSIQVPRKDVDPRLVTQGGPPRVFVGTKGVPLLRHSFLVHDQLAVVDHVVCAQPALKDDLLLRVQRDSGGGGR